MKAWRISRTTVNATERLGRVLIREARKFFSRLSRFLLRMLRKQPNVLRMGHAGTAIRVLRKAQGLSIRELARLAEVNAGHLSQVENGKRDPSPRWLKSVTDALGQHLGGAA